MSVERSKKNGSNGIGDTSLFPDDNLEFFVKNAPAFASCVWLLAVALWQLAGIPDGLGV